MNIEDQVRQHLLAIEQVMRQLDLWQAMPPPAVAFDSTAPFCVDTMDANQWLQWVFIPRMYALLEQHAPLPKRFAITPYFEVALQDSQPNGEKLLAVLQQLDDLLNPAG